MDVSFSRDCGDLHDFGGGGNAFGVGRDEFEEFGNLAIHGLQLEVIFFTPSEWKARVRRVAVVAHHLPLCSSLHDVLNKATIVRITRLQKK